jgi:hypothetical protein
MGWSALVVPVFANFWYTLQHVFCQERALSEHGDKDTPDCASLIQPSKLDIATAWHMRFVVPK